MTYIFFIDGAAVLVAVILGLIIAGGSVKALSDFLAERIDEVYPYIYVLLLIGLAIFYIYKFIYNMQKMRSFGTEWSVCFKKIFPGMWIENRTVLTWLFNGSLALITPVAALSSLVVNISKGGIGGFIIDIMLFFIFLLLIMLNLWLFIKALDFAGRCTIRTWKTILINIGFSFVQWIVFSVIEGLRF